ncbi:17908_t:CDS:2 [Cetraspora pellucida]|uniref:17908_t:CDS:1 n=1 Tax=Cetraspora pellucida TaxID=1433469 RepID=A0ACA9MMS3_9GLOM|nr:17908_t:CDS:2 [Cetraspora pellucida]
MRYFGGTGRIRTDEITDLHNSNKENLSSKIEELRRIINRKLGSCNARIELLREFGDFMKEKIDKEMEETNKLIKEVEELNKQLTGKSPEDNQKK